MVEGDEREVPVLRFANDFLVLLKYWNGGEEIKVSLRRT